MGHRLGPRAGSITPVENKSVSDMVNVRGGLFLKKLQLPKQGFDVYLTRSWPPLLVILASALAVSCQSVPRQNLPPDQSGYYGQNLPESACGGVSESERQRAYQAALDHVRRRGLNESQFRAGISGCARTDLEYYRRVLQL